MKSIVINACYGGFGLSYEAVMLYAKKKGMELYAYVLGSMGCVSVRNAAI